MTLGNIWPISNQRLHAKTFTQICLLFELKKEPYLENKQALMDKVNNHLVGMYAN